MKILHIADLHLGAKLSGFNENASKFIRDEIFKAITILREKASSEAYDGLIFLGDIFDSENIPSKYISYIESVCKIKLEAGGFVAFATGNHDYWLNMSYLDSLKKYDKFFFFGEEKMAQYKFEHKGKIVKLYGIGYGSNQPSIVVNDLFPKKSDEDIAIGLLHGDVFEGANLQNSNYLSASADSLRQKGYDYFALGHVHQMKVFNDGFIVYPGCAFSQGYDEGGKKGILSVEIEKNRAPKIDQIPLTKYLVYRKDIDLPNMDETQLKSDLQRIGYDIQNSEFSNYIIKLKVYISSGIFPDGKAEKSLKDEIFDETISELSELEFISKYPFIESETCLPEEILSVIYEVKKNILEEYEGKSYTVKGGSEKEFKKLIEEYDIVERLIADLTKVKI